MKRISNADIISTIYPFCYWLCFVLFEDPTWKSVIVLYMQIFEGTFKSRSRGAAHIATSQLKREIIVTCWKILRKGRKTHNRGNSRKENLNISAKRQNLETFRIDLNKKKMNIFVAITFLKKKDVVILETINYVSVYNEGSTIKVNQYENVNLFNLFWTCIRWQWINKKKKSIFVSVQFRWKYFFKKTVCNTKTTTEIFFAEERSTIN